MASAKKGEVRNPKGRTPGTKNKIVLERERLALEAMRSASKRKAMGALMAREILAWGMMRFYHYAEEAEKHQDEKRAKEYTALAVDAADKLAPYESPRLQSITVHKVDPFDAMSDQQLYLELKRRAREIGLALPDEPKLIEGVVQNSA